jgi:uncharacterized protein involved in cysteine biosynthesis
MPSNSDLRSKSFVQDFLFGLMVPIRAVGVIFSRPKLLTLSLIPILATVVILALTFYAIMAGFGTFVRQWLMTSMHGMLADYSGGLSLVASGIAGLALIFFALNSLTFLASLIASPFNDTLAESTEHAIEVSDIPTQNLARLIRVFFLDLRKTIITLTLSIVFTIGMLIPVVGIVFFLGVALLNTFTFVTYPQSRRVHGVFDSIAWVRKNLGLALGFGVITTLLFGFPVVNLFALPLSVVGGTMLYFRK